VVVTAPALLVFSECELSESGCDAPDKFSLGALNILVMWWSPQKGHSTKNRAFCD
jgi:hypothetical protein